jgi:hypothetical protein
VSKNDHNTLETSSKCRTLNCKETSTQNCNTNVHVAFNLSHIHIVNNDQLIEIIQLSEHLQVIVEGIEIERMSVYNTMLIHLNEKLVKTLAYNPKHVALLVHEITIALYVCEEQLMDPWKISTLTDPGEITPPYMLHTRAFRTYLLGGGYLP